jgi:hypothetical protein
MISRATMQTLNRITAAILGAYAFTWGFTVLGITAMVAMGGSFDDAETGMSMLAFLVYLILFLWTFISVSMIRIWLVLGGGASAMIGVALMLQNSLVN